MVVAITFLLYTYGHIVHISHVIYFHFVVYFILEHGGQEQWNNYSVSMLKEFNAHIATYIQSLGYNYPALNVVHAALYSMLLSLTGMHCKTHLLSR